VQGPPTVKSPTIGLRPVASGLRFLEGPAAVDDGTLLVTEIAAGTLAKVSPDGRIDRISELAPGSA
jgi:gluconolactonase